ncbi:hypothetical protein HAX54_031867 [Datura stramonium]|uniref:Uncharacterized protein n=1 Tax=Datura stramonium TaxID=4076 RepID=A0ABS8SC94_DATST|nr:hypothetical protein [Datura stramonium]
MFFPCYFSTMSENIMKKVEDVMPIATGYEREELEAELQGRDILDINFPLRPFGTKGCFGTRSTSSLAMGSSSEATFYELYLEKDIWKEQ